jgi:uridylate kinase
MKKKNKEIIVISLGGSIIVPEKIKTEFLKKFRKFILKFLRNGRQIIIVAGGGGIARHYIDSAAEIAKIKDEDKDWLGIHATRLNAHLLRTIFSKKAYPVILDNPFKKINKKGQKLLIASGWRPGWSTDYIAVLLAKRFQTKTIINASNIDCVYDKSGRPIKEISWKRYRKLISSRWKPGLRVPFDPVAAKTAQALKMRVIVSRGTDLKNLENILTNRKFFGTIII